MFAVKNQDNQGASICRISLQLLAPVWLKPPEAVGDFAYCNQIFTWPVVG